MDGIGLWIVCVIVGATVITTLGWVCLHRWDPSLREKDVHVTDYCIRGFLAFATGCLTIVVGPFVLLGVFFHWIWKKLH